MSLPPAIARCATSALPPSRPPAGERRAPTDARLAQLTPIAEASVRLAALGPQLAAVAAGMEQQAQLQARRAATIASTMDALAGDLTEAVAQLRRSSGQMHGALKTIERLADHTRLLSVNASIEAARAGEAGRAFAVVVDEVQRLADSSGQSTRLIEERMGEIATSVARVAAVTDTETARDDEAATDVRTVAAVNHEVRGMAHGADAQFASARSVHGLGDRINALTETLLLAVGRFRFEAHLRAQNAVAALLPELIAAGDNRARRERVITAWLEAHPYFELGYLTDAAGRQVIDNLCHRDGRVTHDPAGFGRDWSDRPWFRAALQHASVSATDIYRSTATGDFCFTLAAALRTADGRLLGVFGSDVNFHRLVSQ